MASTIADFHSGSRLVAGAATELEREGLRVLEALASRSRLPIDAEEERAALRFLTRLTEPGRISSDLDPLLVGLSGRLAGLGRADVQHLLDWIHESTKIGDLVTSTGRTRARRLRLLFVLLASVFERNFAAPVFQILREMNVARTQEDFERLLAWVPSRPWSAAERNQAAEYLEVVSRTLFLTFHVREPGSTPVMLRTFSSWPWTRQLLHLMARDAEWRVTARNVVEAVRPVSCDASRFEFELARSGRFGPLARRGGAVARMLLVRMGHSDLPADARRGPGRFRVRTGVLLLVAIGLLIASTVRLQQWNRDNHEWAQQVIEYYGRSS